MAQGIVEINSLAEHGIQDRLNPNLFLQPTPNTQCNAEMKAFAHQYVPELNRENLMKLSEAVLAHIPYVPAETSVLTSAIEAFNGQQGLLGAIIGMWLPFVAYVKKVGWNRCIPWYKF
ncbi:hypothetical protein LTR94_012773 [Friedmanniomyces endolithicus]|nr:hypothetical protein LTR94_012773 [Friedmanniomyces endolithicus]